MCVNQNNYDELVFRKTPKYIIMWLSFIMVLLISFTLIICFYKYNKFYQLNGLVIKKGSDDYVQILLKNDKLDIVKNDNLTVNKERIDFTYEISPYIYSDSNISYREIKLFFNNNYKNGEIVNVVFKSPKTTILEKIKRNIKKGLM